MHALASAYSALPWAGEAPGMTAPCAMAMGMGLSLSARDAGVGDRGPDDVRGLLGLRDARHLGRGGERDRERAVVGALLVRAAVRALAEAAELDEPEQREIAAHVLVPRLLEAREVRLLVVDGDRRVVGDQHVRQQPEAAPVGDRPEGVRR